MEMTLDVPDEIAAELRHQRDNLARILALGLREVGAEHQPGYKGVAEVLESLARLPTADEVLQLRPSPMLQARISFLLEKNRSDGLTADEEREWQNYQYLEHLVRIAKAKAKARLSTESG